MKKLGMYLVAFVAFFGTKVVNGMYGGSSSDSSSSSSSSGCPTPRISALEQLDRELAISSSETSLALDYEKKMSLNPQETNDIRCDQEASFDSNKYEKKRKQDANYDDYGDDVALIFAFLISELKDSNISETNRKRKKTINDDDDGSEDVVGESLETEQKYSTPSVSSRAPQKMSKRSHPVEVSSENTDSNDDYVQEYWETIIQ